MKDVFACVLLVCAVMTGTTMTGAAFAADADVGGDVQDPLTQAVLDCHTQYAKRYAKMSGEASATEIATGAQAHCKAAMDAYAKHTLDAARSRSETGPFAKAHESMALADFKHYVFSYTVDAVIRERALF